MNIQFEKLSQGEIKDLIKKISPQFDPPLADDIDIEAYSLKLCEYARFLISRNSNGINGCIIHYLNRATSIIYITLVWVDEGSRGRGLSKEMFYKFFEEYSEEGYLYSDLEVLKINLIALKLYNMIGYRITEDRGEKFLMRLSFRD